jgi:hypothetical protein
LLRDENTIMLSTNLIKFFKKMTKKKKIKS